MKRRITALVLALTLCCTCLLPLKARAAGKDPMVMRTMKKDGSGEHRYWYDVYGNCVYEEIPGTDWKTYYTFNELGNLVERFSYDGDDLLEASLFDDYGNPGSQSFYTSNGTGKESSNTREYDDYGRVTWQTTETIPVRAGKELKEREVTRIRYEYYREPITLLLGSYEQDNNFGNGPEPIEWQVLDTDGERLLLVSKYALDSRVYHSRNEAVSWEDSELCSWLNGYFLENAFTEGERTHILWGRLSGGLEEEVFLLSRDEVERYFPEEESRLCAATQYAVKRNAYVNGETGGSWWLLRTPGTEKGCVMSVNSDGVLDTQGGRVTSARGTVRPAVWVCKMAMQDNARPDRKHIRTDTYEGDSTEPVTSWSSLLTYNDENMLSFEQVRGETSQGYSIMNEYDYDDHGNITMSIESTRLPDGDSVTDITTFENTYDKNGRLVKKVQYLGDTVYDTTLYRYDWTGRKIWEKTDNWEDSWKYDRYGNLLQYSRNGIVQESYSYTYVPLSQALWTE